MEQLRIDSPQLLVISVMAVMLVYMLATERKRPALRQGLSAQAFSPTTSESCRRSISWPPPSS